MRINEVEQKVGISKKNIRFYEEEGLLNPARSAENGYRDYSDEDVCTLQKIRLLRRLAVPIENIRCLEQGTLSLPACMETQSRKLEKEKENLRQIRVACEELAQTHDSFASIDVAACEARMREMEEGGTRFMDILGDKRKKMVGPVAFTVTAVIVLLGLELALCRVLLGSAVPWPLQMIVLALPAVVCIGIVAALWLRVREINKGEDDEAAQY